MPSGCLGFSERGYSPKANGGILFVRSLSQGRAAPPPPPTKKHKKNKIGRRKRREARKEETLFSETGRVFIWGTLVGIGLKDTRRTCFWLWAKNRYPKWIPGKWKHGLKPAVLCWFHFDPRPIWRREKMAPGALSWLGQNNVSAPALQAIREDSTDGADGAWVWLVRVFFCFFVFCDMWWWLVVFFGILFFGWLWGFTHFEMQP